MCIRYRINDKVVYREVDDGIVLINLESGFYYSFNGSARFIFDLLNRNRDTGEVVEKMMAEFDITDDEARKDMNEFLEALEKEDIVAKIN